MLSRAGARRLRPLFGKELSLNKVDIAPFEVFCGIDVGKSLNHIVALDRYDDKPLINRKVPQEEAEIRAALEEAGDFGLALVIVDQFGAFGRLVVGVAKSMDIPVAHMSPRRFRQVAETYGEDKFDEKDAFILADASRTTPRNIEFVGNRAESMAEIKVLSSRRDDIVEERTRCYNRLHDFIHQVSPPLEELFSKRKLHNDLEIRLIGALWRADWLSPGGPRSRVDVGGGAEVSLRGRPEEGGTSFRRARPTDCHAAGCCGDRGANTFDRIAHNRAFG